MKRTLQHLGIAISIQFITPPCNSKSPDRFKFMKATAIISLTAKGEPFLWIADTAWKLFSIDCDWKRANIYFEQTGEVKESM